MSSPLQNRVHPDGRILALPERGLMMGNRGGRLHNGARQLGRPRWKGRAWICCVLSFKGRQRQVMGNSYTELFFLDEATALAAGHRPCFECRRKDANHFAGLWAEILGIPTRMRAADMDAILHQERRASAKDPAKAVSARELPDGAIYQDRGQSHLIHDGKARLWRPEGYGPAAILPDRDVLCLTPKSICAILHKGYRPILHPSAIA